MAGQPPSLRNQGLIFGLNGKPIRFSKPWLFLVGDVQAVGGFFFGKENSTSFTQENYPVAGHVTYASQSTWIIQIPRVSGWKFKKTSLKPPTIDSIDMYPFQMIRWQSSSRFYESFTVATQHMGKSPDYRCAMNMGVCTTRSHRANSELTEELKRSAKQDSQRNYCLVPT